jgi:hypothetical protein
MRMARFAASDEGSLSAYEARPSSDRRTRALTDRVVR